mmetsp:Transcript_37768/g.106734  ORF Transcript_37768/g.106734 Transcript_37768/m.106734 type:complete len:248 (-) Transcript_37768:518-1261(-)
MLSPGSVPVRAVFAEPLRPPPVLDTGCRIPLPVFVWRNLTGRRSASWWITRRSTTGSSEGDMLGVPNRTPASSLCRCSEGLGGRECFLLDVGDTIGTESRLSSRGCFSLISSLGWFGCCSGARSAFDGRGATIAAISPSSSDQHSSLPNGAALADPSTPSAPDALPEVSGAMPSSSMRPASCSIGRLSSEAMARRMSAISSESRPWMASVIFAPDVYHSTAACSCRSSASSSPILQWSLATSSLHSP